MAAVATYEIGLDTPMHMLTPRQLFELMSEWQANTAAASKEVEKPRKVVCKQCRRTRPDSRHLGIDDLPHEGTRPPRRLYQPVWTMDVNRREYGNRKVSLIQSPQEKTIASKKKNTFSTYKF